MKKLKVLFYGKPMREIYPFATRWEVRKYKARRFLFRLFKWSLGAAVVTGAIYGAFITGQYATASNTVVLDRLPGKIQEMKAEVLARLKDCESKGYKESDAPMILDTNKEMSLGKLMFQVKTIQHYEQKLYGKNVTRLEAVGIAFDESAATSLANDIIFKSGTGNREWVNCFNQKNLQAEVDMVKRLES